MLPKHVSLEVSGDCRCKGAGSVKTICARLLHAVLLGSVRC